MTRDAQILNGTPHAVAGLECEIRMSLDANAVLFDAGRPYFSSSRTGTAMLLSDLSQVLNYETSSSKVLLSDLSQVLMMSSTRTATPSRTPPCTF